MNEKISFVEAVFKVSYVNFLIDWREIVYALKLKNRVTLITQFLRQYRKMHILEALPLTLLLWRCLDDFNLGCTAGGMKSKVYRKIEKRILQTFSYFLSSTTPQDVVLLEYMMHEVNTGSPISQLLELRIHDFLSQARKVTAPRLKSPHYGAQSNERINDRWKELTSPLVVSEILRSKVPVEKPEQTRPIL